MRHPEDRRAGAFRRWNESSANEASALIAVLWILALLSIVVITVLHTSRVDLLVVKNHGDSIQARYLALAGIEKTRALLYRDARSRRQAAIHHRRGLDDSPGDFRDVRLGRGFFRVFHQDGAGRIVFGVRDEESRLNVNVASPAELIKLPGMTEAIAASILDYRDADDRTTPGGAEAAEYASLRPPYLPRNTPFLTTRELLMVRGMPVDLLMGEDANQNGLLDPSENDGAESYPPDDADGRLNGGWLALVTVDSGVADRNAAGDDRVDVRSASESELAAIDGVSSSVAKAIVAFRDGNKLDNLDDLLNVTPPRTDAGRGNQSGEAPGNVQGRSGAGSPEERSSAGGGSSPNGAGRANSTARVISQELLTEIADDLSVGSDSVRVGVVNVNTASAEVLACLPGMTLELGNQIVSYRSSNGFFPNIAHLLRVPGMTRQVFKSLNPRTTVRSETYRILSEGTVPSSGAGARMQAIVRVGDYNVDILSLREDL